MAQRNHICLDVCHLHAACFSYADTTQLKELQLIKSTLILIAAFTSLTAFAQATATPTAAPATCTAAATEKKLAGAAKASFMKKCEKDAASTCELAAAEKKLAGAAKNSNIKKCTKDAVGG
jgi:hypothetical protein